MNYLWPFLYAFLLNFLVLVAYMVLLNGLRTSRLRVSVSLVFSALVVVVLTAAFSAIYRWVFVPFEIAIYARFVAFCGSYLLAHDIEYWFPPTWLMGRWANRAPKAPAITALPVNTKDVPKGTDDARSS